MKKYGFNQTRLQQDNLLSKQTITTVSYTHLDVYKRQLWIISLDLLKTHLAYTIMV